MTLSSSKPRNSPARRAWLLGSVLAFAACTSDQTKPRGELMLAITTDLSIPHELNQVGVQVFDQNGQILRSQDLDILPAGDVAMPGTLALVPPNSGGQTVRIRVAAKQTAGDKSTERIVREAIVKVPTDRIALLRMPLHWLCDVDASPACDLGDTCKGGLCVQADQDLNDLPDFTPAQVFGGGDAQGVGSYCLDAEGCFSHEDVLTPNKADCSVPLPAGADPASLNVALVLPGGTDGHCIKGPSGTLEDGTCFVPLDSDPDEGFAIAGNKIVLPQAACKRLGVVGVAVSTACRTKDLSVPICGPWTGWPAQPGVSSDAGGASSSSGGSSSFGGGSIGVGGALVTGEGGGATAAAGTTSNASCPVPAPLAPAYYYVLVDASAEMQQSIPTIRQALGQFGSQPASAGILFGLQVAQPVCQGDYSKPVVDFTALPAGTQMIPNFQAGAQNQVQLDDAMVQTLDTLLKITTPASRTLVVITAAVDQGCFTLTDVMRQSLSDALSNFVSLRPLIVTGPDNPTLSSGLVVSGSPNPVSLIGANLQSTAVVTNLSAFRDAVAPCTFVAPDGADYSVQLVSADGGTITPVSKLATSAQCGQGKGFYKTGNTFRLCPAACTTRGTSTVQADTCDTVGPSGAFGTGGNSNGGASSGGAGNGTAGAGTAGASAAGGSGGASASCPPVQPQSNLACGTGLQRCTYGAVTCTCNGKTWTCR
jgi:hypothetical protein